MKRIGNCIRVLLMVILFLCLTGCGVDKISLKDDIIINVSGYDGYGNIDLVVDYDEINLLVEQEKVDKYINSLNSDGMAGLFFEEYSFDDLIDVEIKGEVDNLSNGDQIVISVEIDDDFAYVFGETLESVEEGLGIKIIEKEIIYTVDGLEEAKVLDVLSFIEDYIVYQGANGGGSATIEWPKEYAYEKDGFYIEKGTWLNEFKIIYNHEVIKTGSYIYEEKENLSKGDTIKVKLKVDDVVLGDTGYILVAEKDFIVPDLGEYISKEDINSIELKEAFETAVAEYLTGTLEREEIKFFKYYLGELKSNATSSNIERDRYKLYALFWYDGGIWNYAECYSTEIIKLPDGTYKVSAVAHTLDAYEEGDEYTSDNYDLKEIEWK